jgi:hypothetical protein
MRSGGPAATRLARPRTRLASATSAVTAGQLVNARRRNASTVRRRRERELLELEAEYDNLRGHRDRLWKQRDMYRSALQVIATTPLDREAAQQVAQTALEAGGAHD